MKPTTGKHLAALYASVLETARITYAHAERHIDSCADTDRHLGSEQGPVFDIGRTRRVLKAELWDTAQMMVVRLCQKAEVEFASELVRFSSHDLDQAIAEFLGEDPSKGVSVYFDPRVVWGELEARFASADRGPIKDARHQAAKVFIKALGHTPEEILAADPPEEWILAGGAQTIPLGVKTVPVGEGKVLTPESVEAVNEFVHAINVLDDWKGGVSVPHFDLFTPETPITSGETIRGAGGLHDYIHTTYSRFDFLLESRALGIFLRAYAQVA